MLSSNLLMAQEIREPLAHHQRQSRPDTAHRSSRVCHFKPFLRQANSSKCPFSGEMLWWESQKIVCMIVLLLETYQCPQTFFSVQYTSSWLSCSKLPCLLAVTYLYNWTVFTINWKWDCGFETLFFFSNTNPFPWLWHFCISIWKKSKKNPTCLVITMQS